MSIVLFSFDLQRIKKLSQNSQTNISDKEGEEIKTMLLKINGDVTRMIKEIKAEMTNNDTHEIKNVHINIRLEYNECETLPDEAFELEIWTMKTGYGTQQTFQYV